MRKGPIDKRIIVGAIVAVLVLVIVVIVVNLNIKKDDASHNGREKDSDVTDVITVEQGELTGIYNDDGTVALFAGVPYAKPPVGELRWKEPVEPESWDGVRACDTYMPMAMQLDSSAMLVDVDAATSGYPSLKVLRDDTTGNPAVSEDSLYLNIWAPADAKTGDDLPVIVFYHGGSLNSGQSYYASYNGTTMAENGAIFVTVSSRLGVFGYLATGQLAEESENNTTGNYGLLDQIEALKWVNANIEKFGGDPENITIAGQSSGASSCNAMCVSPLAKGMFRRVIAESSSIVPVKPYHTFRTYAEAIQTGNQIMVAHGCKNMNDMRALSAEELLDSMALNTAMTVDGYAILEEPYKTYKSGNNNEEALLSGYNSNESAVYVMGETGVNTSNYEEVLGNCVGGLGSELEEAIPAESDEDALINYMRVHGVTRFGYSHYAWSEALVDENRPAYFYYFSRENGMNSSWHAGEQAYFYGNMERTYGSSLDAKDYELSEAMVQYVINFAKTGDPNGNGLPTWKEYSGAKDQIMVFDEEYGMKENEDLKLMKIIDKYQQSLK